MNVDWWAREMTVAEESAVIFVGEEIDACLGAALMKQTGLIRVTHAKKNLTQTTWMNILLNAKRFKHASASNTTIH
jgi:hypothetical protein